jgi:hypothetical protein
MMEGLRMDNLTYELRALCRRNRDGSHATQADRITILTLVSRQLLAAEFRRMQATSLKRKHVEALLECWLAEKLKPGTIKNRMAALRWWAQKVGNAGAIPAENSVLGIPDRRFVTNDNKAQQVDGRLERITDPQVRMSLTLQQAFGLRRKMHGLRYLYAQIRYEELTGWKAPDAGGPVAQLLTSAQRTQDVIARQTVSRELGHERPSITAVYPGR